MFTGYSPESWQKAISLGVWEISFYLSNHREISQDLFYFFNDTICGGT